MAPVAQIALSGMLTFGVPVLLAVREFVAVQRRPKATPPDDQPPPPAPRPVPPGDIYSRPLPDCLIPKRLPAARLRELA
jgi:hypothetical protein